jgi:ParB family chromosome partitioning protein
LGRGLGALIPITEFQESTAAEGLQYIAITSIQPNPFQPREVFADDALRELTASIREKGLLQPLLVRPFGSGFQLIAGERRFRAAQMAELDSVPVIVRDAPDGESLELALIENIQRENLNAIEEARAFRRLLDEFGLTQDDVARRVGKSRSAVANSVRLLQLPPEIQEQIRSGKLSAGHARSLLSLPAAAQSAAASTITERHMSVRDAEHLARRSGTEDVDVARAADDLCRALGTRVRIRPKKGESGQIEIEYYSLAELNGLIEKLQRTAQSTRGF